MIKRFFLFFILLVVFLSFFASCTGADKNKKLATKTAEITKNNPNKAAHYYNQGLAWEIKGNFDQAVTYYKKAIEAYPGHARAHNNMAWLMATCADEKYRNGPKAVEFAQNAVHLSHEADFLDTLAASYAESGQFEDAIETQKQAINSLTEEKKPEKRTEYNARLTCYKLSSPWRNTNCIDAFIEPALKAETTIPGPESKETGVAASQDDNSAPGELPIVEAETATFVQTIEEKTNNAKQEAKHDPYEVPVIKAAAETFPQVNKKKPIEPKQDVLSSFNETPGKETGTAISQQTDKMNIAATHKNRYPYTIHLSSFQDEKKSTHLATGLRGQGVPAFTCPVHLPGKGDWYRVFIGHYETHEAVRDAALKLEGGQYANALQVKMPYAVQVGIFDADHDLKKLEADPLLEAYLAYSLPDGTDPKKTRLLVGAYKTEEDATRLLRKLHEEGFKAEVVLR